MIRKLLKKLIPDKSTVFFQLFYEAANVCVDAANLFLEVLSTTNSDSQTQNNFIETAKGLKVKSSKINKAIFQELGVTFITLIDRGDIQELSILLHKLTKMILKINIKLNIYNIDNNSDDCLIRGANTLLKITFLVMQSINALRDTSDKNVQNYVDKIHEYEDNGIEDFRHAMNEIYSGKFDAVMILKLKEIYKNIDNAIDCAVAISDLLMQIAVKKV